jgi:hypothetical protein
MKLLIKYDFQFFCLGCHGRLTLCKLAFYAFCVASVVRLRTKTFYLYPMYFCVPLYGLCNAKLLHYIRKGEITVLKHNNRKTYG